MHVNRITESINEVRGTVEAEMHAADPMDTLEMPILFPPLKVEIRAHILETWTPNFDYVAHELGTLSLDFSKLKMAEVYVVQYAAMIEIRIWKNSITKR